MSTKQKFAHEMVAEVAREMAGAWYEEAAHDNEFYTFYPKQKMFVNREWVRFIASAKAMLAVLLGQSATPEWQKERIMDALVKHASLPGNIDKRAAAKLIEGGDVPMIQQPTVH